MLKINNAFNIGDKVYLASDSEQQMRIVTGINVRIHNHLIYQVTCGVEESYHYDFELSHEKDIILATSS